jgi:hypothetical protein
MSMLWGLAPIAAAHKRCDSEAMHAIQPKYEQSKPERSTFVLRHRGSGAAVILPLLGLLLGILAIALALTDVPLWWLPLIVAVPVGMVDEVRAGRRHSAGSSALCASLEGSRINPKGAERSTRSGGSLTELDEPGGMPAQASSPKTRRSLPSSRPRGQARGGRQAAAPKK